MTEQAYSQGTPRPCPMCNETYTPYKVGGRWTKTCGRNDCRSAAISAAMRNGGAKRARAARAVVEAVEITCEVCGKVWLDWPSAIKKRRTCSYVCAGVLKRAAYGGDNRRGAANPNWRGGHRSGERDRAGERRWYEALASACAKCGTRQGKLALHHIAYRQHVRRENGDQWDPRNSLTLCTSCHMSHHRRGRVLPLSLLPDAAFAFAADTFGTAAYDYLRRRYTGEDERLDALLA